VVSRLMAVVIFDKPYRANREHITRDTLRALNDVQLSESMGKGSALITSCYRSVIRP
jgi:hypothetical protein